MSLQAKLLAITHGASNVNEDFETAVHELKSYFGFFKLQRTRETILRFYSCDGATNCTKCRTGGLHGDCPEFMIFCLVTRHVWGSIFGKFQDLHMQTTATS